jgi:hypothetical protein
MFRNPLMLVALVVMGSAGAAGHAAESVVENVVNGMFGGDLPEEEFREPSPYPLRRGDK